MGLEPRQPGRAAKRLYCLGAGRFGFYLALPQREYSGIIQRTCARPVGARPAPGFAGAGFPSAGWWALSDHDEYAKSIMENPGEAEGLFKGALPPAITQHINWNSLVHDKDSLVDDDLKEGFMDLVFSVKTHH